MDISNVPELVEKEGYALMLDEYAAQPVVYPLICKVEPIPDSEIYGTKGAVLTGLGRPIQIRDGQEVPADDIKSGYTWYLQGRTFGRRLDLPYDVIRASDAVGRITGMVREVTGGWGKAFALEKDDMIADMFQKGTLTAGDVSLFDGTFPNETDPYPGVVYDNLPWFDTAHTISGGTQTFSNHDVANALTTANLQTALTRMRVTNAKDERNLRVRIAPNVLLVPAGAMGFTAKVILHSAQLPGSANNDANVVQGALEPIEWQALDDTASANAWWLGEKGQGILVRDEGPPKLAFVEDGLKRQISVVAVSHFGAAVTNWRYWYNANKAAA